MKRTRNTKERKDEGGDGYECEVIPQSEERTRSRSRTKMRMGTSPSISLCLPDCVPLHLLGGGKA